MRIFWDLFFAVAACVVVGTDAFAPGPSQRSWSQRGVTLVRSAPTSTDAAGAAATAAADEDAAAPPSGLARRERYVATNRFAVRRDRQAQFEKRWANRKSRLATLPGFRYFHLMRRVDPQPDGTCAYDGGATDEAAQENYVSFTIWDKKSDFSAWRKGDAFKEAHGGTSIGAFMSAMIGSAFVLRGPPRPAFYDGLAVAAVVPKEVPATVGGWRTVEADGVKTLPAECFVAMEKFFVSPEVQASFEKSWLDREQRLEDVEGFVAFVLLRRDGQAKGHGVAEMSANEPNYQGVIIFKDRASHDQWKASQKGQAHASDRTMWKKDPETVFYEGTLVLSSTAGP